ncbi:EamA family transporter [Aliidiomarina sedimenti]|uniref:EamA family transporter n=1 Tax=Aliidiomarina sedimenti TaxID=1933879 RepID=A0ABY0C1K6_9GAMM|nr:DMT family transporter [Aliidiomarina sedimenti]RUO31668.1 EamA family transporter [Aliidiomarina sedimenti]
MTLLIGQLAALLAALFWALATLLYNRSSLHLSAAQLNLVKGLVACPLLLGSLYLFGLGFELDLRSPALWWLLLSGVIGITIGDTCYFSALRRLGPAHTILLEYLAPPFAAVLAWMFLRERLSLLEIIAALTVIAGVIFVLSEKRMQHDQMPARLSRSGLAFAVTAAWCQAVGLVMAFHALQAFEINALQAALVRLGGGTLALTIGLLLVAPGILTSTRQALAKTRLLPLMVAIFFGTFMAIGLQQVAIAYVTPGIAQTLLATAPLFMIAINVLLGKTLSLRALLGTLLALAGIALLFLR